MNGDGDAKIVTGEIIRHQERHCELYHYDGKRYIFISTFHPPQSMALARLDNSLKYLNSVNHARKLSWLDSVCKPFHPRTNYDVVQTGN